MVTLSVLTLETSPILFRVGSSSRVLRWKTRISLAGSTLVLRVCPSIPSEASVTGMLVLAAKNDKRLNSPSIDAKKSSVPEDIL